MDWFRRFGMLFVVALAVAGVGAAIAGSSGDSGSGTGTIAPGEPTPVGTPGGGPSSTPAPPPTPVCEPGQTCPCGPDEVCPRIQDSDGDGWDDYMELSSGSDPNNAASTPEVFWIGNSCGDGADNDGDGLADKDDPGCQAPCGIVPVGWGKSGPGQTTPGDGPEPSSVPSEPAPTPGGSPDCPSDMDGDGVPDDGDNCPQNSNPDQADSDGNGVGDACEDSDGDGWADADELAWGSDPNSAASTPEVFWTGESCYDGLDNDGDGATDSADSGCEAPCVVVSGGPGTTDPGPTPAPPSPNDDGLPPDSGDTPPPPPPGNCDFDADNDGFDDFFEQMLGSDPNNASSTPEHLSVDGSCGDGVDNDGDGQVDGADTGCQPDSDGDGVPDGRDNCPAYWNPDQADSDGDGTGDACEDSDGDGFTDFDEVGLGSDPNNPASTPEVFWIGSSCADSIDNDGDGATDAADVGCRDIPVPLPLPPGAPLPADDRGSAAAWGDVDCNGLSIGDAQKIARFLVGLSVMRPANCPPLNPGGGQVIWGDVDCMNGLGIGDAQKIARRLVGLPVSQAPNCPLVGHWVYLGG